MEALSKTLQQLLEYHQSGQPERAYLGYQQLLLQYPHEAQIHYLIGLYLAQQKHWQDSLDPLETACQLDPHTISYQVALANSLGHLQQLDKAESLLRQCLKSPNAPDSLPLSLASNLMRQNKHSEAKTWLDSLIDKGSSLVNVYYNRALIALAEHQPLEAVKLLQKAHSCDAQHLPTLKQLAKTYHQLEEHNQAKPYYQQALSQDPHDGPFKQCAAANLLLLSEDDQALTWLIEVYAMAPDLEFINHNLASVYFHQGRFQEAIVHWSRELEKTPSDSELLYNLGIAYEYMNRLEDAKNYLESALEHNPKHAGAHIHLGSVAMQRYDKNSAIRHYEATKRLLPDDAGTAFVLSALKGESQTHMPKDYVENLFDQYASYYDTHLEKVLDYQAPILLTAMLNENGLKNSQRLLDAGCGTGLMASWLKPFCQTLIGIDLSANMLKKAREKKSYDELHEQNLLDYQEPVDVIVSADVLPYFGQLDALFHWAAKRLPPGGFWAMTSEFHEGVKDYHLQSSARYAHHPDYLLTMAKQHGFVLKEQNKVKLRQQLGKPLIGHISLFIKAD